MRSQPRVDPVFTELIGGARRSEEEFAASFVLALAHVVRSAVVRSGVTRSGRPVSNWHTKRSAGRVNVRPGFRSLISISRA